MLYNKAICSKALHSKWKKRALCLQSKTVLLRHCIGSLTLKFSLSKQDLFWTLGLGSKLFVDGWTSVTEFAAGSASTSEPWGNLSAKICLWIQEKLHNTKVRLLERVMVMEPVDSMILSQVGARKKDGGKQLSQQNYFNVTEVMVLSPILFSI